MYVTYDDLIQIGLLIVAVVGLVYEINKSDKDQKKITAPVWKTRRLF